MSAELERKHYITIHDRRTVEANGIKCVSSLDDDGIILETEGDNIAIEGVALKIDNLDKANATVLIHGEIKTVYYMDKRAKKRGRVNTK